MGGAAARGRFSIVVTTRAVEPFGSAGSGVGMLAVRCRRGRAARKIALLAARGSRLERQVHTVHAVTSNLVVLERLKRRSFWCPKSVPLGPKEVPLGPVGSRWGPAGKEEGRMAGEA